MSISTARTKEIVTSIGGNEENSGSSEAQIGIFTERIGNLTGHLKINKKDKSARRGLIILVSKRARLLKYLRKLNLDRYKNIVSKLELRKEKNWIDEKSKPKVARIVVNKENKVPSKQPLGKSNIRAHILGMGKKNL